MRKRQLGISPAKIAIAVAVTIDAMAGTGGMKKVTGTNSAVSFTPAGTVSAPAFTGTAATIAPVYFKMIPCSKN